MWTSHWSRFTRYTVISALRRLQGRIFSLPISIAGQGGGVRRRALPPQGAGRGCARVDRWGAGEEQNDGRPASSRAPDERPATSAGPAESRHADDGGFFRYVRQGPPSPAAGAQRHLLGLRKQQTAHLDILIDGGLGSAADQLEQPRPSRLFDPSSTSPPGPHPRGRAPHRRDVCPGPPHARPPRVFGIRVLSIKP